MLRPLTLIAALAVAALPLCAETAGPRPLASAIDAIRSGSWDNARALGARAGDGGPELVEWFYLRAGQGSTEDVVRFLAAHPDWPGLKYLRKRSEPAMEGADPVLVLAFFNGNPPQTGRGVMILSDAHRAVGQAGDADVELVRAWREMDLTASEHDAMLAQHAALLAPHHTARLDMLLWRGLSGDAERMLPLVDGGWQALALARMALRRGQSDGVNALIAAVPDTLIGDAGLAYERFQWRARKGLTTEAVELALARSESAKSLGRPETWAGWRSYLAHSLMRDGKAADAYRLAANHQLSEGSKFADLEWLSGYISLRYQNDPARALDHFQRFRGAVDSPISLGRAGYWIGRAQEASGDPEGAKASYIYGAQFQTSFYGLLAAEKAGVPFDPDLTGKAGADWRGAPFTQSLVYKAGVLAQNAGQISLAEQFLTHLAEGLNAAELRQFGDMAVDIEQPHLAVMIGKEAAKRGLTLPRPYYALHPLHKMALPVPTEISLAIARRESEFDPNVVSGAGAQGLMQLMPATAAETAGELGLEHQASRVLSDWPYNATLGSAYLAKLARRFDGNITMIAAGYNAGPSRPDRWMVEMGDPRNGTVKNGMDVVDWIEHIPFSETRNYVMRVSESLPVYRARLGRNPHPVPFSRELVGSTILPLSPQGE